VARTESSSRTFVKFGSAMIRNRTALAEDNLVFREQRALFQECENKAKRTTATDRYIFRKV
jgi:hypothetical protein